MRKTLLIFGALALAGLSLLVIRVIDSGRASASLKGAYAVRDAGELCFSALAASFSESGIDGVASTAASPKFAVWAKMSQLAAASTQTPIFFGKDRVLAMAIAAKQYDELLRTPRGSWMTLTHEIADNRSRLDAAIIAVETEDVSAATITNRRAESKALVLEYAKKFSDVQEKEAEAERVAREKEEAPERERRRQIAEQNRAWDVAQSSREKGTNAAGTTAAPTPLAIDFSRPKPTPMLGRQ